MEGKRLGKRIRWSKQQKDIQGYKGVANHQKKEGGERKGGASCQGKTREKKKKKFKGVETRRKTGRGTKAYYEGRGKREGLHNREVPYHGQKG